MDAPTLVLVPPTPMKFDRPSPPLTPVSAPSIPLPTPGQPRFSRKEPTNRASSETAIFSIYSMYGDDQAARTSWASPSGPSSRTKSPPALMDDRHDSYLGYSGRASSDLAYFDAGEDTYSPPSMSTLAFHNVVNGNDSPRDSQTTSSSRPTSNYATPTSMRTPSIRQLADRGTPTNHLSTFSDANAPGPSRQRDSEQSASLISRRSSRSSHVSRNRRSSLSTRDLPPLPPSSRTTPSPGDITPPRQLSPNHLSPKAPSKTAGKHPPPSSSPSSKVSLVPSEGEDNDSFHVRNTYAQLEVSGVKGDGYEEGIERTRARIGTSRQSQLDAEEALGNGKEKMRDLHPKEIQFLANVDRYGFFTIPSHDRLILLNSGPLLKRLAPSSAGPPSASPSATSLSTLPPVPRPIKEASRIAKWTRMLMPLKRSPGGNVETWRIKPPKASKLRERTYKGVPDRWRGAAWDLMMTGYSGMTPQGLEKLVDEYHDALEKPSSYDIQIDLDVPRTISGHIMFKTRYGAGQRSLFHVLHCFSLKCETCGYVQGMGPIAATLLCYFEPERVYASLVRLHDAYNMHTVFNPGFPGLLEAIYVQERITEQMMPDVYAAFRKHMISTTSYATKWYITLFANSVPFQTQLRIWDAFLLEGYDVFVAVAVAIVWVYRDHITSNAANFETVLSLLSSFFVPEDENALLSWIEKTLGDKKLRASVLRWKRDWKELVATGKDATALL